MPYDLLEKSANAGRPRELYQFTSGNAIWSVTSYSRPITFLGQTYKSLENLDRTPLKQSRNGGDDSINVTVPKEFAIAKMFGVAVPPLPIKLTIYRHHAGDGESHGIAWTGRVRGCEWQPHTAELLCDGANSMLKRAGLRMGFDIRCPHVLYEEGCNLNRELFAVSGTIEAVTKNSIQCSAFATKPNDWLKLGYVVYGDYNFMIASHAANTVTVFTPLDLTKLPAMITVKAYAGCDHLLDTCWSKFNNGLNTEANAWMPNRNIFRSGY